MTTHDQTDTRTDDIDQERRDLLESLHTQRFFLRHTVAGLSDDQARQRTTVSELTLGGLVKHVMLTEAGWLDFAEHGAPEGFSTDGGEGPSEEQLAARAAEFTLLPEETLAGVLAQYEEVAARADRLVATLDLDHAWPLPPAPWFEPGGTRSVRRVITHVVGETAQHAGHADILREALDGQKTMG
ncbi:DinB family protein [Nocardioides nanhaiensis]|uniref:DinB family protein n=1 Tax=Nocardioides nanhaiensis TaxID=1476871 RepID=A0ABP8WDS8_9ACTN